MAALSHRLNLEVHQQQICLAPPVWGKNQGGDGGQSGRSAIAGPVDYVPGMAIIATVE
jgi:hypothetical protein